MSTITSLENFELYQDALKFATEVLMLCKHSSLRCEFSLVDQVKRSGVSVPANIAEGFGRSSKKEFARFLSIAHGSLNEIRTYFDIMKRMNLGEKDKREALYDEAIVLSKRLYNFRKYLK